MARAKKEVVPLGWEIEDAAYADGYTAVCGCDEAGRGPLAGPVVAAAVILPRGCEIPGLNDSKKLTEKKREALFDVICDTALAYAIAEASVPKPPDTHKQRKQTRTEKVAHHLRDTQPHFRKQGSPLRHRLF